MHIILNNIECGKDGDNSHSNITDILYFTNLKVLVIMKNVCASTRSHYYECKALVNELIWVEIYIYKCTKC